MEIIWLISGVILGGLVGWFMAKSKSGASNSHEGDLNNKLQLAEERYNMIAQELTEVKPELSKERGKSLELSNQLTQVQTEHKNLQSKLSEQKEELEKLNQRFALEFKNLANEIFEEKSKKFTEQNKTNIHDLLNPLKEKIGEFQKKVEDSNKEGAERNASLVQQIKHLSDLNKQITKEAENLTKALKGDSKAQGNWGEVILERILEKSGLEKGREYETQVSETGDDGKRYQPDVVIKLPDNKHVIVDSKVSLTAYERFVNEESEAEKLVQLKLHINSIKAHVKGLSEKSYQNLYGLDGLDFVLLFIPIEPAFTLAVQHDPDLFNDAYAKNIVIVSPTTLIATLRTIASIWKQEYQNKNAIEIARQGGALYDKFQSFTEDLISIGKHLNGTQKAYQESMKKLSEGSGNLVKRAETLKKLGAKASKNMDERLLNRSEE
ncbi:DNA recombination protein RmuC [Roseivirga sp. E12]|uniref:DNA recombination protein RmuC n=1 Tax=Roseivirga sp. E12 TaxID=2819237 RepID=UPI001ABBEDBB|nr:DNA recombination protein RmuC [Roseivirga sp. E12]MBO3700441.1 DNA recombination protein RmuC [Roseivirga sp. E12]